MRTWINDEWFGNPNCGVEMQFNFAQLVAHAATTRPLKAGSIIGSGTISNSDETLGSAAWRKNELSKRLKPAAHQLHFYSLAIV